MKFYCLDPQNPLWMEALAGVRHDVYHLPNYIAIESRRTHTTGEAFVAIDGDRIFFVPYLIRNCQELFPSLDTDSTFDIVSPYGYPGIILSDAAQEDPEFVCAALEGLTQTLQQKKICSAFLRMHPILGEHFAQSQHCDLLVDNGTTVSINLHLSEAEIWAHTRKGHQSSINKCKRMGFEASIVPVQDYFDEFLAIYQDTMHRVSAQEFYFFDSDYFNGLMSLGDKLHLCIVQQAEQVVSALFLFECCGIVQAHLGGTKTEFLSQSPFMAALNHARYWAKERGNELMHIGGGIGGSDQDSLFKFKSGFSRQRHAFFTLRLVIDPDVYHQLIGLRAQMFQVPPETFHSSEFFPAYRAKPVLN
ncbi:MAG TPA: hypothetical protein V6D19_12710 [Stenomitos sp.]